MHLKNIPGDKLEKNNRQYAFLAPVFLRIMGKVSIGSPHDLIPEMFDNDCISKEGRKTGNDNSCTPAFLSEKENYLFGAGYARLGNMQYVFYRILKSCFLLSKRSFCWVGLSLVWMLCASVSLATSDSYHFKPFAAFEPDYLPKKVYVQTPKWYNVTVGYTEIAVQPPAETFTVGILPEIMFKTARTRDFDIMSGYRHAHTDYSIIREDPFGKALPVPFALGEITYALVKEDSPEGIELSFYHHRAGEVDWVVENNPAPSRYRLNEFTLERSLTLPSNHWLIIALGKKEQETIVRSERTVETLYRYFFIKVMHKR